MTDCKSPARPRPGFRPAAAVSLVAALLVYVGCSTPIPSTEPDEPRPAAGTTVQTPPASKSAGSTTAPTEAKGTAASAETPRPPTRPLFDGWPAPAGVVVFSGEQLGYLEPCGCTQGQLGGLLRRYAVVERIRNERKWPVVLLDLGSLVKDPAQARGGPEQAKIKFNVALKALTTLKYDAFALSAEDLKVGVDEAVGQFLNLPESGPKVLAANVTATGLESKIVPSLRVAAGKVTVGVTAVIDPEALKALKDPSLDLLTPRPIDESLPSVLADLEKDTQTQVLMVQGPPALAKELAGKYPGFDLVVATSVLVDPEPEPTPLNGGKTLLVNVGQKGKYIGVIGVFEGDGPKYRYQRITLNPEVDGPSGPMKKVIEDEFRETLKQQRIVENFPRHEFVSGTGGTTGSSYAGVEACKSCHPNTVESWAATKHANAFESLVHDPKPNSVYDAECVTCHTTGFEFTSGWKSPELTSYLKGNQCENCHGPGSKHAADPLNPTLRAAMHLTRDQADKNRVCLRCHDEDNSPHFEFAKYWDEIEHNALDTPRENMKKLKPAAPAAK
ncbi:MAG: multiheme c-type cytochrome [Isosphaeraceae bacterium]